MYTAKNRPATLLTDDQARAMMQEHPGLRHVASSGLVESFDALILSLKSQELKEWLKYQRGHTVYYKGYFYLPWAVKP